MDITPVFQFYAELDRYEPKIWRRFLVPSDMSVDVFMNIVMTLFNMDGSHLCSLTNKDKRTFVWTPDGNWYEDKEAEYYNGFFGGTINDSDDDDDLTDEEDGDDFAEDDITIADIAVPRSKLKLNYDFGDNWKVTIKYEKTFKDYDTESGELPRVLEGAGYGIIRNSRYFSHHSAKAGCPNFETTDCYRFYQISA